MRYLSVCSGIEAASVAWHHLGWTPVAFSEIEPFPAAVLKHRFPHVPNYGDMTKFKEWPLEPGAIDLLVGGTPCQSFSVAGLRKGLSDPRGGLMLTYLEIAQRLRPKWILWENVPGVLSASGGRDFGSFLGALSELRYGWAYRVIDAQYCRVDGRWPKAVPQRRRRVFVVGCLLERDPRGRERASEVLALGTGLRWHLEESGKARKAATSDAEAGARASGFYGGVDANCSDTVTSKWSKGSGGPSGNECGLFLAQPTWPAEVAPTLNQSAKGTGAPGYSNQELFAQGAGCLVPQPVPYDLFQITAPVNRQNRKPGDPCHTLARDNAAHAAVAFHPTQDPISSSESSHALGTGSKGGCATAAVAFANRTRDGIKVPEIMADGIVPALTNPGDGGRSDAINVAVTFTPGNLARGAGPSPNAEVAPTQRCSAGRGADDQRTCVAIGTDCYNGAITGDVAATMGTPGSSINASGPTVMQAMTVRRLTPRECERLQGFPDEWTLIPWRKKPADECPDGPRYKALGNSMAVNCMAWIGERIDATERRGG